MPARIQHASPPVEARSVSDLNAGDCPLHVQNLRRAIDLGWKKLSEGLATIKQAGLAIGRDFDSLGIDTQLVAFIPKLFRLPSQKPKPDNVLVAPPFGK